MTAVQKNRKGGGTLQLPSDEVSVQPRALRCSVPSPDSGRCSVSNRDSGRLRTTGSNLSKGPFTCFFKKYSKVSLINVNELPSVKISSRVEIAH